MFSRTDGTRRLTVRVVDPSPGLGLRQDIEVGLVIPTNLCPLVFDKEHCMQKESPLHRMYSPEWYDDSDVLIPKSCGSEQKKGRRAEDANADRQVHEDRQGLAVHWHWYRLESGHIAIGRGQR